MLTLGVSAFYHDSAVALVDDGVIVAAAQEERFTRRKHDMSFPQNALRYCIEEAGVRADEVSAVVFYEKPFLKFERILETYLAFAPRGFVSFSTSLPIWVKEKLFQKQILANSLSAVFGEGVDWKKMLLFSEHHLSHAASAFYPSPFQDAAVLTMDGVGEWATTSLAVGEGNDLTVLKEITFPHSIGLLYSAFTYFCRFQSQLWRIQTDGSGPLWSAKVCCCD